MRLYEFEGKALLQQHGIPIPAGQVARTPGEAESLASTLHCPVMVKSQVFSGGRGKAGGIRKATSPDEARDIAVALLGSTLKNETVTAVLVEEACDIVQEFYIGITVDGKTCRPMVILSLQGGVDVEESMRTNPQSFRKISVDPYIGLQKFMCLNAAMSLGMPAKQGMALADIAVSLYAAFQQSDAIIGEINPLVWTREERFLALDAKFDLDDYAAGRHPEYAGVDRIPGETPIEKRAKALKLNYVELDGTIGIAGNGAGLMMTTVDVINRMGGKAGNFCDAGGANAKPGTGEDAIQWWSNVVQIVLSKPEIKVFLFNLHGGNHRGDEVATGLVRGLQASGRKLPMVVRLSGTRQEEGRAILAEHGIVSCSTMDEAVRKAVALAQEV